MNATEIVKIFVKPQSRLHTDKTFLKYRLIITINDLSQNNKAHISIVLCIMYKCSQISCRIAEEIA